VQQSDRANFFISGSDDVSSIAKLELSCRLSCALLSVLALAVGQMTFDNIHCKSRGYSADDFLAYYRSQRYADYEHGALYYGLEPAVRTNVRNAKVIFLGSSKTQAAFSTNAVRSYFDNLGIEFFVMGFGYGEWSTFALSVLKRSDAAPKKFRY
jgi:hypothetical protein